MSNILYEKQSSTFMQKMLNNGPMKLDIIENNEKMISSLLCRGQTFIWILRFSLVLLFHFSVNNPFVFVT